MPLRWWLRNGPQEVLCARHDAPNDPTMRIAQVMAGAPAGGAELFYERLITALVRAGDQVLPVIRRDSGRTGRLRAEGVEPVELAFGGPFDLRTAPRLGRLLRDFAPRVTVAWMNRAARFTPAGDWVLAGRLGGFYDLRYYRRCDHLIGNTRGIVDWITGQGWPGERAHHLPNFVPDLAGAAPAALPVPAGAPTLLALGRLHPNKAFDTLIRAMPLLPDVHAVIAGEGSERSALMALAAGLGVGGRVHLPGWRHDTAGLLAAARVLVCPSRHEPLGNVVIEGWSAARPVVATAAQGPSELIVSGRTGLLVRIDDPPALADAIRQALDAGAAQALAAAGRLRYETDFAEARVVARWRQFLATVEKR
jgi:glycosyltransferase involved in cell wall biosynthesis